MSPGIDGDLHLVGWGGADGIFYKHWTTDGGWGAAERIDSDFPGGSVGDLAINLDELVHIIWVDGNGAAHLVQGSGDQGWNAPKSLNLGPIEVIRIAIDNDGNIHFVWIDADGGMFYGTAVE